MTAYLWTMVGVCWLLSMIVCIAVSSAWFSIKEKKK